ncbi:MAG: phosphoribosylamine--glycine ligase [Longimicrobiales bacterium]
MKVLVVGNGGREHALLWKLRRDAPDAELFVTRGNGGTHGLARALPLDVTELQPIAGWAENQRVDLVVIGPEAPLAAGIVDVLTRHGIPVFGPTRAASAIEASKAYAKELMARAGVPTAGYRTFTEATAAEAYIRAQDRPLVVKASGLAAGKGAVICDTPEDAVMASRAMLVRGDFGEAGAEIVIEERLEGEEVSVFALTDGHGVLPLLPAQDHKRVGEAETGPNTGGMGAYAPVARLAADFLDSVRERVFLPTLAALRDDGCPFTGLLYAGLMETAAGPVVIEFNARFGDPETQALLPLLKSSLLEPMLSIARGEPLPAEPMRWRPGAALTTVLASRGYPGHYDTGKPIRIPEDVETAEDVVVFHAGTKRDEQGRLVTAGGRVLSVTALAPTLAEAASRSRAAAAAIRFEGRHYRQDIGWRALVAQ